MSNVLRATARRKRSVIGIVGAAVVATALTAGLTAAQSGGTAPSGGVQVVPVGPDNGTWQGGPGDANGGPIQIGPDGGNGSWQSVTVGPDGGTYVQGGSGQVGGRGQYGGRGGVIQVMPYGKGGMMSGGFGGPGDFGSVTVTADGRGVVTVTAINGTTVSLKTDDGWTKDVDTANVVITRDGATLAVTDLAVGDTVQVAQTRNANGTYTITGLLVVQPQLMGSVASIGSDSFTITQMDGSTTTVHVSATTTWQTPGSTATGLAALSVGDMVVAQGKLEADGSMDASSVMTAGMPMRGQGRQGGPGMMGNPATPVPAASPAASPAANG